MGKVKGVSRNVEALWAGRVRDAQVSMLSA